MMKSYKKIIFSAGFVFMVFGIISCKKYLDKSPEASISEQDVFTNFRSFQGFTEELNCCLAPVNCAVYCDAQGPRLSLFAVRSFMMKLADLLNYSNKRKADVPIAFNPKRFIEVDVDDLGAHVLLDIRSRP